MPQQLNIATTLLYETERLSHRHFESADIHQFTFREPSKAAYDELIARMDKLYTNVTEQDTVRMLVDYRESGIPQITHIFRSGINWANGLEVHPTARMAIVTERNFMVNMLSSLAETTRFSHLSINFFQTESGYTKALDWLSA